MSIIIEELEKKYMKKDLPSISVGDTAEVSQEIVEGKKKRIQKFEGIIIKIQNSGNRKSMTLRKVKGRFGVEKSFLLYSPLLKEVKVKKKGKVRRARLFYLRDRIGKKATRIKSAD